HSNAARETRSRSDRGGQGQVYRGDEDSRRTACEDAVRGRGYTLDGRYSSCADGLPFPPPRAGAAAVRKSRTLVCPDRATSRVQATRAGDSVRVNALGRSVA